MTRLASVLLVMAAAAAAACSEDAGAIAPAPQARELVTLDDAARRNAGITVAAVATTMRADTTEAPGVIALDERSTARIGSLVEGIVIATTAEVGDRVTAKQQLAAMHSTLVHEAWAGYRKAIAERRRLDKELAFAAAAHDRAASARLALHRRPVQRAAAPRQSRGSATWSGSRRARPTAAGSSPA